MSGATNPEAVSRDLCDFPGSPNFVAAIHAFGLSQTMECSGTVPIREERITWIQVVDCDVSIQCFDRASYGFLLRDGGGFTSVPASFCAGKE